MVTEADIRGRLPQALAETQLPLPGRQAGKVRDWYALGDGRRLLVTTDRLSAFDRVLACVPYKGQVLNQLAAWWFARTAGVIPNHVLGVPDPNALLALEVTPIPVEVVVRGFITGVTTTALWHRYALGEREIYGHRLPDGLGKNEPLPQPIITPTTKGGPSGHDERLTCAEVVARGLLDAPTWEQVQAAALAIFRQGQALAQRSGLILVDTKYEFGRDATGQVRLIDEVHTPDSSRYWLQATYEARLTAGQEPENFDKELVRLAFAAHGYRGDGEAPAMPAELWVEVSKRYVKIFELLTGQAFEPGDYPVEPRLLANLRRAGIYPGEAFEVAKREVTA
ncbi:MAG: phosphoribosylaminoimidazolesuccinocarboxamide synthase [Anaerolineales bacterium]|nr:phosphoribosylaminoimidazolesuccinocarboxamide synthase [Anaerolineales bacterium]